MQHKLHLNLRQRAALRTAISFWERKEVQDRIIEFLKCHGEFKPSEVRKEWRKLTKIVLDEWNKDILPKQLEDELIHIVKMIGEKILSWYHYIKYEYGTEEEAINCIDKIYWTPYGTVDIVKILKSSWLENPNLDITKLYYFACSIALEDLINDLWDKIPKNEQNQCYIKSYMSFDRHIKAYWKHRRYNDLPNLMSFFEAFASLCNRDDKEAYDFLYVEHCTAEENMFRLSIHQGYFIATKYFWEQLTEEKRNENILNCARIVVLRHSYYTKKDKCIGGYKRNQYIEICIFLMNQMTKSVKKLFFNELELFEGRFKDEILYMLLSTWPWQELFIPVLKDILQYQNDDSEMPCMFLDEITNKMVEDHKLGYFLETNRYRSLLHEAWVIIPTFIKQKMIEEDLNRKFICNLINVWDLDSLNLILNDPAIATVRNQFIAFGLNSYNKLIVDDRFQTLDQFIDKIFRSEEEKRSFKRDINPWSEIFKNHKFDMAEKFLDWQSSTPEERQFLKNNINHMELCVEFIEMNYYDLFDEFLDWKFETEEERIKCENHFKSDIFVIRQVYDIWRLSRRNINSAKHKSSRFLNWVFESNEEIIRFKNEKLTNVEIDQLTIHNLIILNSEDNLANFLYWCLFDEEEVERIKEAVTQLIQEL